MRLTINAFSLLFGPISSTLLPDFQSKCTALANDLYRETGSPITVNFAQYLHTNSMLNLTAEGLHPTCVNAFFSPPPIPVDLCRLSLKVATSKDSSVAMEAWLPANWTGRYLTTGNGALAGCIQYPDMAYGALHGFATIGTDNGHSGMVGEPFFHHPQVLEDFVWRAIYTGTVIGKKVTKEFYGKQHSKSYYLGCSTGGRQGWKAAQSHPDLFDGIVAGAPALMFGSNLAWYAFAIQTFGDNSTDTYLPEDQWAAIHQEVLKQCDNLDGVMDEILEDTRKCKPDIAPLLSNVSNSDTISDAQLAAIQRMFSPFIVEGHLIHPGANWGYEVPFFEAVSSPVTESAILEWFRYVVTENPSWNLSSLTPEFALLVQQANPFNIETFDGDLSAFRDRGAKILHWHGQADHVLAEGISNKYYAHVQKTMNASVTELDEFYRYFRIAGMGHCQGGNGANVIGQTFGFAVSDEPDDNVLMRIVEWVEHGNAPDVVRGTKLLEDDPTRGIVFRRKHCKFPLSNVYTGTGNGTDEEGWQCVEP
jgi:feruloyl esterase